MTVCVASAVRLPAQNKPLTNGAKLQSDTQQPIPRDGVPLELQRLIDDGRVDVVYDSEPEFVKASRGWADFHVQLQYSFQYDLKKKSRKNGRWHVSLSVTKLDWMLDLTHLIRLPATFKSSDVWNSRLLRHEFDHVAVSLDPRAKLLLRHLLRHFPDIERTLEPTESPTNETFNKLIESEIVKRRDAVIELMRQNNRLLDKVGSHGTQAVPDRAQFFAKLYTKENLAEQKFPFVTEVLDLLETSEYQQAELPFLPRDPVAR